MSDTLRDLITRTLLTHGTVTCAARADAILTALDEAGYTIVKRDGWQTVGHLAPGTELKIRTTRRCPSALRISGAQCDLDEGHTGWHRHNGNGNGYTATWVNEPTEWLAVEPATTKEDQ